MGLACCRPAREPRTRAAAQLAPLKVAELTRDRLGEHNGEAGSRQHAGSDDGEWWDAESMESALSRLSLADALGEWETEQRRSLDEELGSEVAGAVRSGARLVPAAVEAAAVEAAEAVEAHGRPSIDLDVVHLYDAHVQIAAPLEKANGGLEPRQQAPPAATTVAVESAAALYCQGRVLAAHAALQSVCQCPDRRLSCLGGAALEAGVDVALLADEVRAVHAALDSLRDDTGWMVSRDGDFRVLYRHQKGGTCHSLKFTALLPHPVTHILALVHEWDLLPTWNRFALEAVKIAEPSIFESVVYGAQWMMRPFRAMQALVHARGYDLAAEHRCLLVLLSDADADALPEGHAVLPAGMAARRTVNLLPGCCLALRPLAPGAGGEPRTEARLQVHLDPHIPYVPAMLVNFVLGVLAPYLFAQMRRVLDTAFGKDDGGVARRGERGACGDFLQRIRDQPELYGLVDARMAEFAAVLAREGGAPQIQTN